MTGDERARERAGEEEDETWQGKERGRSDVRDLGNTKGILEHTRRTGGFFPKKAEEYQLQSDEDDDATNVPQLCKNVGRKTSERGEIKLSSLSSDRIALPSIAFFAISHLAHRLSPCRVHYVHGAHRFLALFIKRVCES